MIEHITTDELKRYLLGELEPAELLTFDRHIADCGECRHSAASHPYLSTSAAALEHALSAKWPRHLTFDEMEGLIDEKLTGNDLARVEAHFKICSECRDEVDQLREFAEPVPVKIDNAAHQPMGFLERLAGAFSVRRWAYALVPAVLLAILFSVWFFGRRENSADLAASNATGVIDVQPGPVSIDLPTEKSDVSLPDNPTVDVAVGPSLTTSLKDGGTAVGIDSGGKLVGYDRLTSEQAEMVRSAIRNGTVTIDTHAKEVIPASEKRMGESPAAVGGFRLKSPTGMVLDTSTPEFLWQPLDGAETYRVEIFDINYRPVATSGDIRTVRWTAKLPRGATYIWQVTGSKDGKEVRASGAPEARFRTLDTARSQSIASIKRRYPSSHLLLGLAYAEAGMIDDARREIGLLSRENRDSPIPKKLLTQIDRSFR